MRNIFAVYTKKGAVTNQKIWRQPLILNELLTMKIATVRNKSEGGVFHSLFALC